jgi:hypothetical protein
MLFISNALLILARDSRGRGWCELVNPFGQVNWKNVGQFVGTN